MRLNTANRSFYTLVGLVAVPYVALATIGCGLIGYVITRFAADGAAALTGPGWDLHLALVFLAVIGAGTTASVWSLQRQWRATRDLAAHVRARAGERDPAVDALVDRAGLCGRVEVVDELQPFCFTYGLRSPRVAVSTELVRRATGAELGAVLAHERYHVHSNDPFKLVVARSLTRAFFFLPVLAFLHHRYLAARELAADRHAVRDWGRTSLVGALIKAASGPGWSEVGAAAAIGGGAHLQLRVDQLENSAEPALPPLPRPALWATAAGLGSLVALLVAAISVTGGREALMGRMDSSSMPLADWLAPLAFATCTAGWVLAAWLVLRWWRRARTISEIPLTVQRRTAVTLSPTDQERQNARRRQAWDKRATGYDKMMGWWERRLLGEDNRPWACDRATGDVLEVAIGTGLNLPFYRDDLDITGVDLSPEMLDIARERADETGRNVHLHQGDAHNLASPDGSFDTVVCTFSLCNIPDLDQALSEMRRVLRPGGQLVLVDHIRSSVTPIYWLQKGIEVISVRVDGDHMTRRPAEHVEKLGFEVVERDRFRWGIVERLVATKPA